jgi:hypothetical protein
MLAKHKKDLKSSQFVEETGNLTSTCWRTPQTRTISPEHKDFENVCNNVKAQIDIHLNIRLTNNIHTISGEISNNSKEEVFLYLSTSGQ